MYQPPPLSEIGLTLKCGRVIKVIYPRSVPIVTSGKSFCTTSLKMQNIKILPNISLGRKGWKMSKKGHVITEGDLVPVSTKDRKLS